MYNFSEAIIQFLSYNINQKIKLVINFHTIEWSNYSFNLENRVMRKSLLKFCNLFWTQVSTPHSQSQGKVPLPDFYWVWTPILPHRPHQLYLKEISLQYLSTPLHFRIPWGITSVAAFRQVFEGLIPYILPYLPLFHSSSSLVTCPPSTLPVPYEPAKQNVRSNSEKYFFLFLDALLINALFPWGMLLLA